MNKQTQDKLKTTRSNLTGGPGPGRPKGSKNKTPALIREMVSEALNKAGGVDYLVDRAKDPKTAGAFLSLVGKVLPVQVTGAGGGPVETVTRIELVSLSK